LTHVLVEQHAEKQRERVAAEQLVGGGVLGAEGEVEWADAAGRTEPAASRPDDGPDGSPGRRVRGCR
jgi:hypothetical protein